MVVRVAADPRVERGDHAGVHHPGAVVPKVPLAIQT